MNSKVLFGIALLFLFGCKNNNNIITPPEVVYTLEAVFYDCSCIEAWIDVKTTNVPLPYTASITLEDTIVNHVFISSSDTTIRIDSLLPNHFYPVKLTVNIDNKVLKDSLSFTTMDTTSNNFQWTSYEFGVGLSNIFYDVAVIDENDIWVVGEYYLNDSTGHQEVHARNAMHWNGSRWDSTCIPTVTFNGVISQAPIRAIFAFNKNDIWTFSEAGSYSHWNGIKWKTEYLPMGSASFCMWGSSPSNLYIGGWKGCLLHYNGINWKRIETGLPYDIDDIYGAWDEKQQRYEIIGVASDVFSSTDRILFKIEDEKVTRISDEEINYSLRSVWFKPNKKYIVAGAGIYEKYLLSEGVWRNKLLDITTYYTDRVRGTEINNIFAAGAFGDLVHFNGKSWRNLRTETALGHGQFSSISVKNNVICAVGENYSKAVIYIGKHK